MNLAILLSDTSILFALPFIIALGTFATYIKGNNEQEDKNNEDNEKLS